MRQPVGQKISRLQTLLSNPSSVAATASTSDNAYEEMMRQGVLLDDLKRTNEQFKAGIAAATPKPYRNRALALYNQIAPLIHFNDKGELLSKASGQPIVDSHAEDLIQHAVRDRRKHKFIPTGWDDFTEQLHQHNIPRMMLNHATINDLQALGRHSSRAVAARRLSSVAAAANATPLSSVKKRPKRLFDATAAGTILKKRKHKPSSRYPPSVFLTNFR